MHGLFPQIIPVRVLGCNAYMSQIYYMVYRLLQQPIQHILIVSKFNGIQRLTKDQHPHVRTCVKFFSSLVAFWGALTFLVPLISIVKMCLGSSLRNKQLSSWELVQLVTTCQFITFLGWQSGTSFFFLHSSTRHLCFVVHDGIQKKCK